MKLHSIYTFFMLLLMASWTISAEEDVRLKVIGVSQDGNIIVVVPFGGVEYPTCLFSAYLERPKDGEMPNSLMDQLNGVISLGGERPEIELELLEEGIVLTANGVGLVFGKMKLIQEIGGKTDLVRNVVSSGAGIYNGKCKDPEYDALLKSRQESARERGVGLWQEREEK